LAFARGDVPGPRAITRRVQLPILADHEPERGFAQDLALAEQAASAARNGQVEEAEVLFARLSQTSRNIQVLETARAFFVEIGNLEAAQSLLERKLTLLHDKRLAAREYASILTSHRWLDDVIAAMPSPAAAQEVRALFSGNRFQEVLIQSMAEHFTVGEILALSRFYRTQGGTIAAKFGRYIAKLPQLFEQLRREEQ
jgi:hypothetical protein